MAIPIVNQPACATRSANLDLTTQTDVIWEDLVDARTVELTANDNTIYNFIWLDTKKGPLVVEIPPEVLGAVNDFWYRWVADVGITGEDRGKGGKYLVLPPGYKGEGPGGLCGPSAEHVWQLAFLSRLPRRWRHAARRRNGQEAPEDLSVVGGRQSACDQVRQCLGCSLEFFVAPGDYAFWELLNKVIQEEPSEGSDPTTLGLIASIGIVKGQPFSPDERMKKILTDAANIGAVTARTIAFKVRSKDAYFFPDSTWRLRSSAAISSRARPA